MHPLYYCLDFIENEFTRHQTLMPFRILFVICNWHTAAMFLRVQFFHFKDNIRFCCRRCSNFEILKSLIHNKLPHKNPEELSTGHKAIYLTLSKVGDGLEDL